MSTDAEPAPEAPAQEAPAPANDAANQMYERAGFANPFATAARDNTRFDSVAPASVLTGSRFNFDGQPPVSGIMTRVENRNILTTADNRTYEVRSDRKGTTLTRVERGADGKFANVAGTDGRPEVVQVPKGRITMDNPTIGISGAPVRFETRTGEVRLTGGTHGRRDDTVLRLTSDGSLPVLRVAGRTFGENGLMGHNRREPLTPEAVNRLRELNEPLLTREAAGRWKAAQDKGMDWSQFVAQERKATRGSHGDVLTRLYGENATTARNNVLAVRGHNPESGRRMDAAIERVVKAYQPPSALERAVKDYNNGNREAHPLLAALDRRGDGHIGRGLTRALERGNWGPQQGEALKLAASIRAENGWQRGHERGMPGQIGDNLRVRDPGKMPGLDGMHGDRFNRVMENLGKNITGLKPGDTLDGLLGRMQNHMNARELARLGEFLLTQLGRRGNDALGLGDINRLGTIFRGFGDRSGLNLQIGDNRAGLGLTIGQDGRLSFQIRIGGLTLGFGDSRTSGLAQIGNLLFTNDGRSIQQNLGVSGLRATDIIGRSFSGQNQWNPFTNNTGDSATQTSKELTGKLTQGNHDFIKQLQENSAKLTQQMEAAKQAQIQNAKFQNILQQGDFRTQRQDQIGKQQMQQHLEQHQQQQQRLDNIAKMQQQQGAKADGQAGKFTLTGGVEMDGRPMDARRGQMTAASHESTLQQNLKGDMLQNPQAKGEQFIGPKTQAEKMLAEEEAKRKLELDDKKKGDLRNDQQFIKDEEERREKERKEKQEEREEHEEELEEMRDAEAKRRALLLIMQARKKKEQELKEKALKEQVKKQEESKRAQYRVAIGDSLETIATKQLRNPRLAALVFDINKKVIPIKILHGREVAHLSVGVIIHLPSVKEIKEFSKTGFSLGPKFNKVDFSVPAAVAQNKSAEEELEAMFGSNWNGTDQETAQSENVESQKRKQEMDEFNKRRQNIESVLGKMGPKKAADGRMRYTVRLGDTLKSIAMKHPSLEDVSSWRILAEINKLSTETDENDNPVALVTRGSVLMIPTKNEVEEYKKKLGLRKAIAMPGQSVTTGGALPGLKECPSCGKKSLHTASMCDCGSQFATGSLKPQLDTAGGEAPYLVGGNKGGNGGDNLESTNNFQASSPRKEDRFESAAKSGHVDGDNWSEIANLDADTRIVKLNSVFDTELEFSLLLLQTQVEGRWLPVAGYEMREDAAVRIDYTDPRHKSSVRIDLPPSAAQDLAKNDLVKNWQNYKRKFMSVLATS